MTDLHIFLGHFPIKPPRILGHELAGTIDSVGKGVDQSWIGQSVGIFPAKFCGNCGPCLRGYQELCENFKCLGNTSNGGYAEYAVVDVDQLVPLRDIVIDQAIWLEPLACIMLGLNRVKIKSQSTGIIVGAGTLGKLIAQVLKVTTNARIGVVDPNQKKIDEVRTMGAETGWVIPRVGLTGDIEDEIKGWARAGLQFVIDTTGSAIAIERSLRWAGPAADVLLFGVSNPLAHVNFSPADFFSKELVLTSVAGMTQKSFQASYELLSTGKLNTSALVEKRIGLAEVPFEMKRIAQKSAAKILIQP